MENLSTSVEPELQKKNFFQHLSHSQKVSFLSLIFIVIILPVATALAMIATRLNPRAYLPTTPPVTPTPTFTPTPTPIQTCSAIQKYSFESPCRMPVADDPKIQEGSNIRVQSTYTYINFTCADGYYESFRFRSCSTTESLLRQAQNTCQNHLVIKPTFGNKCLVPINKLSDQGSPDILPSETPKKGQMGFDSIKFSCPDGFVSGYEPKTCTTSASLNTYANKVCLSHLVCSKPTPTPSTPKNSAPVITTTSLVTGTVGKNYSSSITATDVDPGDALTMTISGLPIGLRRGPCAVPVTGGTVTCYFSGTPSVAGTFKIYVEVIDKLKASTSKILPLTIITTRPTPTISKNTPPSITTSSVPSGVAGKTYLATITAKDLNSNDNLDMTVSGLPFGVYQENCRESSTTTPNGVVAPGAYISCTISGTPVKAGLYKITAKVQDDKGASSSKSFTLTITPSAISCKQECPGADGVLRSCTPPEADGTSSDSLCNYRGRLETCGNVSFCCPSAGGKWTKDLSACKI